MKKILMTTTALVAAGFIATAAHADDASDSFDPTPAPGAFQLGLGGYYKAGLGFTSTDRDNAREYGVKHDVEVYLTGETTLDNGLTVGTRIELNAFDSASTSDTETDEAFAYFRGSFGEVRGGSEDSARRLMSVTAPQGSKVFSASDGYLNFKDLTFGATTSGDAAFDTFAGTGVANTGANVNVFDGENDTVVGLEDDSAKAIYFTPSFSGFTGALSYTPEEGDTGGNASNGLTGSETAADGDILALAVMYEGQFNNRTGLRASFGYETQDSGQLDGTDVDDVEAIALGLAVDFDNFEVGGSYGRVSDISHSTAAGGGVEQTDLDATIFDLGATYNAGAYLIGVSGSWGEYEYTSALEAELTTYQVSGTYNLGTGVDLTAAIQMDDLEFSGGSAAEDQDTTAFLVGTDIRF